MLRHLTPAVLFLALAVSPVAASDAEAVKGLLVERCADCHVLVGFEDRAADVGAPTFIDMIDDSETYTEARVRQSLRTPHWPMEQFVLSTKDIDRIVAYFTAARAGQ